MFATYLLVNEKKILIDAVDKGFYWTVGRFYSIIRRSVLTKPLLTVSIRSFFSEKTFDISHICDHLCHRFNATISITFCITGGAGNIKSELGSEW